MNNPSVIKLKPEVKAAWVKALRSGQYRKGQGRLRQAVYIHPEGSDTKPAVAQAYCCLGVLCDLAVKAGVCDWDSYIAQRENTGTTQDPLMTEILPQAVYDWALTSPVVTVDPNSFHSSLSWEVPTVPVRESKADTLPSINDYTELTFNDIADLIEANY